MVPMAESMADSIEAALGSVVIALVNVGTMSSAAAGCVAATTAIRAPDKVTKPRNFPDRRKTLLPRVDRHGAAETIGPG